MRSNQIEAYKSRLKLLPEQREVLVGVLLGDATLETQNRGMTYRVKIEHSVKQRAYADSLYQVFREWVLSPPRIRSVRLSNGKVYESIAFSTVSHGSFRFYAQQFYRHRKKVVPRLISHWLTPKALAYWFMDDGSIKSKQSKGVLFNTQGYMRKDVEMLVGVLKTRFDLEAKLRRQREGFQIYISGKSYEKFAEIVSANVLPEMKYKIPEARRTHLPKL